MGTWRAAEVQPARSHRTSGSRTAFMGHRTVRGTVPQWLQRCAEPVDPGPSRVPSGSQPGPEQSKKEALCTWYALFRSVKTV